MRRALPESGQDDVQGLGKGMDRSVKKKLSSKTISIRAHSHAQMPVATLQVSLQSASSNHCHSSCIADVHSPWASLWGQGSFVCLITLLAK